MRKLNKNKLQVLAAIIALVLISTLSLAANTYAAAMPVYERVQAISTTVNSSTGLNTPSAVAFDAYENIYVTDSTDDRLVIYGNDGSYVDSISGLDEPISVAVGNGKIYIGSGGSGEVSVYDSNRNYLSSLGNFSKPTSIAVDSAGKVYVVDAGKDIVNVYNADGSSSFSFGGSGNADGQFHFPTSIAINNVAGEIIVSDLQIIADWTGTFEGARIQVFDINGNHMRSFGDYGVGADKIFRPSGVDVDEEGRIYVSDVFQNVVQVYDADGTHLGSIHDPADLDAVPSYLGNPMRTPVDVKISNSNKLYIASFYTYGVEVYRITDDKAEYAVVIPEAHDYGEVYVNTNSAAQTFTVNNVGSGDLDITSAVISGADAGDFALQADLCTGNTLAPADTCDLIVIMSPVSETSKSAEMQIASTDPEGPLLVALSGAGTMAPNEAPVADAGGPYDVNEGTTALLDASASSDPDGSIVTYAWDLDNDGSYETIGNPMGFDASSLDGPMGPFFIGLQVTDNLGATGSTTTSISVSNVPPAADAGGPYSGEVETAISLSGSAVDPADILTYDWDLDGDGTYETSGANTQVTYNLAGDYTVGLRVTDDDGGIGLDTAQVSVTVVEVPVPTFDQVSVVEVEVPVPTFDIALKAGWNLIGWVTDIGHYKGLEPQQGDYASGSTMNSVADIETVIDDIGLSTADYTLIVGPGGKVHVPGSPFNTLKSFLPGRAYWIAATQDITIALSGEVVSSSATSSLPVGWSQVAYNGNEGLDPEAAMSCIDGSYDLIVDGNSKIHFAGLPFGNLVSMHQSKGYFVHMTAEGTLTYNCP
jgi:sugar lactone lactonase YvrE